MHDKLYFFGIDTALVNMGVSVLSLDYENVFFLETAFNTAKPEKAFTKRYGLEKPLNVFRKTKADFIKTSYGVRIIEFLFGAYPVPAFVICEGPAFGIKGQSVVSVGASHGAVQTYLYSHGYSFGVAAPVLIKAFAAGNPKADKDAMRSFAEELTQAEIKDHNAADAVCMAVFAACFHFYRLCADTLSPDAYAYENVKTPKRQKDVKRRIVISEKLSGLLEHLPESTPEMTDKRLDMLFRFYLKECKDWIIGHSEEGYRTCRKRPQKKRQRNLRKRRS